MVTQDTYREGGGGAPGWGCAYVEVRLHDDEGLHVYCRAYVKVSYYCRTGWFSKSTTYFMKLITVLNVKT